ncbi:taste receptor type 2 member 40-like [Rhinoderma darwinii]|uniref:taste receptor type 2 member 40-like n=1 Tax=Rhinoderma darwinii TaxID=43563 RepID=UPI003F67BED0
MSAEMYFGVFALVEGAVAITLNASIIILNMKSLRRGSKLTPPDVIHMVMGMVNISLRGLLLGHFLGMSLSASYITISFYITVIALPFLMYYTFWLTAWLCAYYCSSITTFSHRLFPWMKRCLTTSLPRLLVSTGLASFVISFPAIWIIFVNIQGQYIGNGTFVLSSLGIASRSIVYTAVVNLLGCCLPFVVIFVSLVTSVSSLLRHVWNIKQNNSERIRPKLQSHINAIRTMTLLLILSGTFYTAENILFSIESMEDVKFVVSWFLIIVFPTAEAAIIIQASLKLRKIFLGAVCPAGWVNNMKNIKNLGILNPELNPRG